MDDGFLDESFDSDVDLTPLIDVVFLLLVFFILAATFSQPVMQVTLPAARTAERVEDDPARLVLSIAADGQLFHREEAVPAGGLAALLERHPDGAVELRVDQAAPFDAFVAVMDPLREAGRSDVLVTAQPK